MTGRRDRVDNHGMLHHLAATMLLVLLPLMMAGRAQAPSGAIRPSAEYPRYWEYKGKPILLLGGSKEDNLFQIPDLEQHLDLLVASGGNYVRNTLSSRDPGNVWPFAKTNDGLYDLTKFEPAYWERIERLLTLAAARDIIVQVELWDRFDFAREPWQANPYNPKNNVNYTSQESGLREEYPKHPGSNENRFFYSVPGRDDNAVLLKYQRAQVERFLETALRFPNVLYCMDNETSGDPAWGAYWARFVRDRARARGGEVHVTEMWDAHDLGDPMHRHTLDNPLYTFVEVSQNNHMRDQAHWDNLIAHRTRLGPRLRPLNNVKIYGADGGRFGETRDGIERFWRNIFGGAASVRFHRPESGIGLSELAQRYLKSARELTARIAIHRTEPAPDLLLDRGPDEAYALAERGRAYAVYFTNGGDVRLQLGGAPGKWRVDWLDAGASVWTPGEVVEGGGPVHLKTPGQGHWVAVLTAERATQEGRG